MRRNIGKLLISIAAMVTAVVPFLADWNDSHIFSSQWSPHARFHGTVSLGMTTILSSHYTDRRGAIQPVRSWSSNINLRTWLVSGSSIACQYGSLQLMRTRKPQLQAKNEERLSYDPK